MERFTTNVVGVFMLYLFMIFTPDLWADSITKPHTFSPGTVAKSSEVNANFDTVYDQVNKIGSIITVDDVNVRVGISIAEPDNTLSVGGIIESTTGGIKFPDGTTQITAAFGDGHSLDGADGTPVDALFVGDSGNVAIGGTRIPYERLEVNWDHPTRPAMIRVSNYSDSDGAGAGILLQAQSGTYEPGFRIVRYSSQTTVLSPAGNPLANNVLFTTSAMGADIIVHAGQNGDIIFEGDSNNMRIDGATGNVGIGTASPVEKLSVNGTVESKTGGFKFPDGTTQTSAAPANSGWHHSATTVASDILAPWDWTDLDLSSYVGQNHALVTLKFRIKEGGTGGQSWFAVRTNGDTDEYSFDPAASSVNLSAPAFNQSCVLMVETDSNGIIEWKAQGQMSDIILVGYVN